MGGSLDIDGAAASAEPEKDLVPPLREADKGNDDTSDLPKPAEKGDKVTGKVLRFLYLFAGSCLLYTSPSPRDGLLSRMPSSA